VVFLRNVQSDEVASAIEFLSIAVDLANRRAISVPSGIHSRLVELLLEHEALDWPAPRCGSISV